MESQYGILSIIQSYL